MHKREEINKILKSHKELNFDEVKNVIYGRLFISQNDFYEIKVSLAPYPLRFPFVEETGERIPQSLDRHKYYKSDICCLTTEAMGQILLKTKVKTLSAFFELMVIPYFKNNSFYELNRCYFKDEYSHSIVGIWEGYQDILDIKSPYEILNVIKRRLNAKKIKIRDTCYCKSGIKLKKCKNGKHSINYRNFRLISLEVLQKDANELEKVLNLKINE